MKNYISHKGIKIKTQEHDCGQMVYISFHRTFRSICGFLQERGYRLQLWDWHYEDTTFPGGTSIYKKTVFVALKPGEEPAEDKIYTTVFQKEIWDCIHKITTLS